MCTGWSVFWKQFHSYCQQVRGTMFLPLAYAYRTHVVVTQDIEDSDFANSDLRLMSLVVLDGGDFQNDNAMLWDVLAPLVMDGTAWPFIKKFEGTKNGRAAILTLKSQAEGKASETTRKAEAYSTLDGLQFDNKTRNLTFDSYVAKLQFAFTELHDCNETMAESRKVSYLLRGMKSEMVESAKAYIMGDAEL
jgi:hypothetical protein